jgi:hypothetical protein
VVVVSREVILQKFETLTQQEHAVTLDEQLKSLSVKDVQDATVALRSHLGCDGGAKLSLSGSKCSAEKSTFYSCCCSPLEKNSCSSHNARLNTPPAPCPCASSSPYYSSRIQLLKENRTNFGTDLDFDIQASKITWTEGTLQADHELVREENRKAFEELKGTPNSVPTS